MIYLPDQHPEELFFDEFPLGEVKPKGILDYLTHPPKCSNSKGLLGVQPKSQNQQPTTLLECLGVKES